MLFVSISVNATIYGLELKLEKAQCENKDLRSRNSTLEELLQQKSEKEEKGGYGALYRGSEVIHNIHLGIYTDYTYT